MRKRLERVLKKLRKEPAAGMIRRAAVVFAGGLFLWALCLSPNSAYRVRSGQGIPANYVDAGKALIHGLDAPGNQVSDRLPLSTVLAALLSGEAGGRPRRAISFVLVCVLTAALGALTLSPACGMAALALLSLTVVRGAGGAMWTYPQDVYSLLVALAACLLVWRAQTPSLSRSVWFALSIGAGLMFRSPLAFFPPLLAAFEWWSPAPDSTAAPKKDRWKVLLVLCTVPYLFLIPNLWMNWILYARWIPFERGPSDNNIIAGAAGVVMTMGGDLGAILGKGRAFEEGGAIRWAVEEVLRHPLRYAGSVISRFVFFFSLEPLLLLLALLSAWLGRKRREIQTLALLAGYFLAIHCLMTVNAGYFAPIWPLLSVLGAGGLSLFFDFSEKDKPSKRADFVRRLAARFSGALLAAALLLCAYAGAVAVSYGRRASLRSPDSGEALNEALSDSPEDPWLLERSGDRGLRTGDAAGAVRAYSAALSRRPLDAGLRLDLAWAMMLDGNSKALDDYGITWTREDFSSDEFPYLQVKLEIARFIQDLRSGNGKEAKAHIDAAWEIWSTECTDAYKSGTQGAVEFASRAPFLKKLLEMWGGMLSPDGRRTLIEALLDPGGRDAALLIHEAGLAHRAGDTFAALRLLDRLDAGGLDFAAARRVSWLYAESGRPLRALRISSAWTRRRPRDVDLWIDKGHHAARAGRRRTAGAALARARSLGASSEQLLRVAVGYQQLKDYVRAIEILGPLTRDPVWAARALRDQGVCEFLRGEVDAAAVDLGEAVRRDPGLLSAYLSLASVYSVMGRRAEEIGILERGLAAAPGKDERSYREALRRSLELVAGDPEGL